MSMSRDFKGIWIPKEIWLHPELSIQAKALWAEIDSLFDPKKGGCYASNEYLSEFMQLKDRQTRDVLKELKDNNLVVDISFDGRERVIKAILPVTGLYAANQHGGKPPGSVAENCMSEEVFPNEPPIDENKTENVVREEGDVVQKKKSSGQVIEIRKSDIYAQAIRTGKDWTLEERNKAWQALIENPGIVNDPFKWFEGTVANLRASTKKQEHKLKGEKACYTKKQNAPGSSKEKSSAPNSRESVWEMLHRLEAEKKNSQSG